MRRQAPELSTLGPVARGDIAAAVEQQLDERRVAHAYAEDGDFFVFYGTTYSPASSSHLMRAGASSASLIILSDIRVKDACLRAHLYNGSICFSNETYQAHSFDQPL
jgi:hypothetical protein